MLSGTYSVGQTMRAKETKPQPQPPRDVVVEARPVAPPKGRRASAPMNPPRRATAASASDASSKSNASRDRCALCGTQAANIGFVQVSVVRVLVCDGCSKPLWHGLGLVDWFRKRGVL